MANQRLVIAAVCLCALGAGFVLLLTPTSLTLASSPIQILYPQNGTLFPNDIVAPTVRWRDAEADASWQVTIDFSRGADLLFEAAEPSWQPDADAWRAIKERSREERTTLTVRRVGAQETPMASIEFSTSADSVEAPIFFRDVPLPFRVALKNLESIRWRLGAVSEATPPTIVLEGMPVCGNCHSFSADGKVLAMDVDYGADKGSYIIAEVEEEIVFSKDKVISWSDYQPEDDEPTFGLLAQISPDGRYVVSTVKDRSVFVPMPDLHYSQFFFPVRGILVIYDRETGKLTALPGASDPDLVQSSPAWSPDGQWIVFSRAPARQLKNLRNKSLPVVTRSEVEEFVSGGATMRYDLYRVPFNGGLGGVAEPIAGASANDHSNYFAKFSPDGRWIVYCQADAFMLLQPDSELHIVSAAGGQSRRLACNTSGKMNSWHSFSPNGKWLVFSSKVNGPYTQLWLTHLDDQGEASPAVLLEHFTDADRAANIPEFANLKPGQLQRIQQQFADEVTLATRRGDLRGGLGELDEAARNCRRALELQPDNPTLMQKLAGVLLGLGKTEQALELLEDAVVLAPADPMVRYQFGIAMIMTGDFERAIEECRLASELFPGFEPARINLATALHRAGRIEEALVQFENIIEDGTESSALLVAYAAALEQAGHSQRAAAALRRAMELDPSNAQARIALDRILLQGGS